MASGTVADEEGRVWLMAGSTTPKRKRIKIGEIEVYYSYQVLYAPES